METTVRKGDVYLFAADNRKGTLIAKLHAPGPFLECFAKNIVFEYWANQEPQRNESISLDYKPIGYSDIIQVQGESKTVEPAIIGVFIPWNVSKSEVAEDLRSRFGSGTILVKPDIMTPPDSNMHYLSWVKAKHRSQDPEFVAELIRECASEFALRKPLSDDARAQIYAEVRQKVQTLHDERLRRHAKIPCNS